MTNPSVKAISLLEDWRARRAHLAKILEGPAVGAAHSRDYAGTQIRILDYLVQRYAGQAEGLKHAEFPLSKVSAMFLVQQHMIRSRDAAERVLKTPLSHLNSDEQEDLKARQSEWRWKYEAYRSLDDSSAEERLSGIQRLAYCGSLDDIGLLSSLLEVRSHPSDDAVERQKLLWAIQTIVHRHAEKNGEVWQFLVPGTK